MRPIFDAKPKGLYVSCGEGLVDVIAQPNADTYQLRECVATRTEARTGFFSPDLDEFYLALPMQGAHEAELRVFHTQN